MHGPKIYSLTTRKGGVLKTSLTTNLAGVLCKKGRVLIIDTDPQGDCLLTFGRNPDDVGYTLYDVLMGEVPAEHTIVNVTENIDIIPSNDKMVTLDFKVIGNVAKFPEPFNLMRKYLQSIIKDYEYVLIDSPGHFGLVQGNIINFAQQILIPFQPETYSMRSLVKILAAIEEFKNLHGSTANIAGVVATMVESKTVIHSDILSTCRKYCLDNNINIFDTIIPKSIRFASAVAYGNLPATLYDPHHVTSKHYFDLTKEIFGKVEDYVTKLSNM
jgi:chromosome partitioning protein